MSSNHPLFPPAGNNNNNNKKKRKHRIYLPSGDDTSGQNKRRNAPQRANTPMMAAPAQPAFGFGNPQLPVANPAIYGPHNPTPFTPMSSASLMPQYTLFPGQLQPQAQYLQQHPQHVPQTSAYQPTSNVQPTSGFASPGFAAGQQTMNTVPTLATGSKALNRNIESSDSTENLISTKTGGRRQQPGKPQSQAQLPAPAQAQAHPQGQPTIPCPNCNREDHLVGDCVGPPNRMHGDLPACPVCNSFGGGRRRGVPGNHGHKFDDCQMVQAVFHRLQKGVDSRLTYEDLANITEDELLMFFNGLVKRRVRKTPIRTKLVCWVDVLREIARRHPNAAALFDLVGQFPWTKSFALDQLDQANLSAKPWVFYDYAAANIGSLPAGPVEQISMPFADFVAKGLPGVPPQVFSSVDRQQRSENREMEDPSAANIAQPQGSHVIPEQQPAQQPPPFTPMEQAQQQQIISPFSFVQEPPQQQQPPVMSGEPSAQPHAPTPSREEPPAKGTVNQAGARQSSKSPGETAQISFTDRVKRAKADARLASTAVPMPPVTAPGAN